MENKFGKKILTSGPSLKIILLVTILILSLGLTSTFGTVYGHGVGSETFPPVDLDGKQVTLEVSSSQNDPDANDDQQISISLIDFDSKITLRDVKFLITAERGEKFLFEREFNADNGFLVFNFVSEDTDEIILEEESNSNLFGSLLGLESRMIHVKGPNLSNGGLYKFDVYVLTADGYSNVLPEPLVFNAGISIAQTTSHTIYDEYFGAQRVDVITYYDEISNFQYNSDLREISYTMPFEWTATNINQTSVVHEELSIPKSFGDLLASGFIMNVNGVDLSEDIVNIDDFFTEDRVVHFIIYQKELLNILENGSNDNQMNFKIRPSLDYSHLSSVTENGQFRILVSWEPENLQSNSNAKINFDVTDIFLKNRPVSTNYDFSISQGNNILYQQSGISTDSKDEHNVAEFFIPEDVTGIINLNFYNLDGNDLARTTIPVVVDREISETSITIPEWIRNNALWWSDDQIDDATFIQGIEYLIKNEIIQIPPTQQQDSESKEIPEWIRNNAEWWGNGLIDDETFVQGLEYLIQKGIIRA